MIRRPLAQALVADMEMGEQALGCSIHKLGEGAELSQRMQAVAGLPAFAGPEPGERRPDVAELSKDYVVERSMDRRRELCHPDDAGKHPQDM